MLRRNKKFKVSLAFRHDIEPEEIFFDSTKLKEFEESDINAGKLERPISSFIFSVTNIVQILVLAFFLAYSAFLIIAKGDIYAGQAEDNSSRAFPIFAERGLIYSSEGSMLAQNEIYFNVFVKVPKIKTKNPEEEFLDISKKIADALDKDWSDIYEKFMEAYEMRFLELVLVKGISSDDVIKIKEHIGDIVFIEIRETSRRRLSPSPSFSHIVGYTGEVSQSDMATGNYIRGERIGKTGVEAFYNDDLRGETGIYIKKIDSRGKSLGSAMKRDPKTGQDLRLHVSSLLQEKVYGILKKHMRILDVTSAVAIVLNPKTGAILSAVSLPSFDANLFEIGIDKTKLDSLNANPNKPFINRVVAGEYPSGSIIKPIIAAAALEEGIVTPSFLIYSGGSIYVPSVYNSDVLYEFKDWKAHGWTDMRKAISDSVNIYFYTIGGGYKDTKGLGMRKIEEYLKKFGWGESLGIDIPGERSGLVPNPKWKKEKKNENWYIGDTYHASIGQGDILVTPLQVAAATAVFANDGVLFVPHIVASIGDKEIQSEIIRENFISKKNLNVVKEGMQRAVESGSSKFLSTLPQKVAGKTGTAQTGKARNHAWFTGFGPYDDPEVVITVLLEEGEKSSYAVRVAKEIFEAYFELSTD